MAPDDDAARRATPEELAQGEDEIRRANQRMEAELASGAEPQLEDKERSEAEVLSPPEIQRIKVWEVRRSQKVPRNLSFLLVQKRHHRSQLRSRQVQRSQFLPHQGNSGIAIRTFRTAAEPSVCPQVQIKRLFWHPPKLPRLLRPLRQWWYRMCKVCQMDLNMQKMILGECIKLFLWKPHLLPNPMFLQFLF